MYIVAAALSDGSEIPTEHHRYVEVWLEIYEEDISMEFEDGEFEQLSRIMTKEEAMAAVIVSHRKINELLQRWDDLESAESHAAHQRRMNIYESRNEQMRELLAEGHRLRMGYYQGISDESAKNARRNDLQAELNARANDTFTFGYDYVYETPTSVLRNRLDDL